MKRGINLLGEKQQISLSPLIKRLQLLRSVAIIFLFAISAFSVVLFLLIALSPLPALQKQEENLLSQISRQHPDIAKLQLIGDRLTTSNLILQERKSVDSMMGVIEKEIPDGATITALNIQGKEISITVTSKSLFLLNSFVDKITVLTDNKKTFSKAVLIGLVTNQSQNLFELTINLTTI